MNIFNLLYVFVYTFSISLQNSIENTELELVFVIFRHGERVPEKNEEFPNDEYKIEYFYPLTNGDITKEGQKRQYHLGKKLRKRYKNFLGPIYTKNIVATYSTDFDRTKISALLTLAGLFPPDVTQIWDSELKWLPIPYHYKSFNEDYLIRRPDPYCTRYVKELKNILQSPEILDIHRKYKDVFDYVTNKTGRNIFDFHEMLRIYQNINAKKYLNLTIPEWALEIYPEPLQTIASYQCLFENYNPLLRKLNGGHILKKFIEISSAKIEGNLEPKDRKIFLFSGHENNIVNILAILGLFNQHVPPYCSAVILELHRNKFNNDYGFKVVYDNNTYAKESLNLQIPECDTLCSFVTFKEITKDRIPINYTSECESEIYLDNFLI